MRDSDLAPVAGPVPRRLHVLSPFAKLWGLVVVLAFFLLRDQGTEQNVNTSELPWIGAGFIVLVLISLAVSYLRWWRTSFWFDADGDFRIVSGLASRRERRVQVSRLQAVDVVRPLAARVLGLAEVRIEVAGGSDSKVKLAYLGHTEAEAMRVELLARSAGVEHGSLTDPATHGPIPDAPESVLVSVPADKLLWSVLLGLPAIIGTVLLVGVLATTVVTRQPGVLFTTIFLIIAPLTLAYREFATYFNFELAESPDGLRTRHGLIETRAQTVPPGRVQAVGFCQPPLWRLRGWVRLEVDVAGFSKDRNSEHATVLVPVAPEASAHAILTRVLPGFEPSAVELAPVPERARWRAPIQAKRYAAGLGESVVVSKYGRLMRHTAVVPYARVQSVRVEQGPWQRRLRLATVHVDTANGPVKLFMPERDETQARAWAEEITLRARRARAVDTSERWMRPRP